ncbi:glycosyltransferase involved in cell wall biosynthesis [Salinibacter ruber]|uniref:glycosyltransferase family 2 protein n=1 Tax=Salinibacter ruber TaxID=146919 RepID=UPI0021683C10|nr:glycosyltransferase family 2 protein [Salinibacter ruber]MCS3672416.1 glycosyltransferase involved in cell wall biosynthesis [Salinibacter ruber]
MSVGCPSLSELPDPPPGKAGWPWTKQSDVLPETQPDGSPWPKISIVTPSYNQGEFIEETIRSILLQGYPNLEYIVVDGGSDDETVDILKKYDPWIDHWVSEPDRGQSHAINKGIRECTGSIFNWINADDLLVPHALRRVGRYMKKEDVLVAQGWHMKSDKANLFQTNNLSCDALIIGHADASGAMFTQQAIWLRTEQVKSCGGVDTDIEYAMDQDLYIRYLRRYDSVKYISVPVAVFRLHEESKTGRSKGHFQKSQHNILDKLSNDPNFKDKKKLIRWSRSKLNWKQKVRRVWRSESSRFVKAIEIVKEIYRRPRQRLDRPTLGAILQIVAGYKKPKSKS